jgi:hypothetical protein
MDTIRVLHRHETGYGWSFESPNIPGLTGDDDAYDQAHAEEAARFALARAADEQGRLAPTDLIFEHYVRVGAAPALWSVGLLDPTPEQAGAFWREHEPHMLSLDDEP